MTKKDLKFDVLTDDEEKNYTAKPLEESQENRRIFLLFDTSKLGKEALFKISNLNLNDIKMNYE